MSHYTRFFFFEGIPNSVSDRQRQRTAGRSSVTVFTDVVYKAEPERNPRNFAKNNAALSWVRVSVIIPQSPGPTPLLCRGAGQVTGESLSFATNLIKLIFIHNLGKIQRGI